MRLASCGDLCAPWAPSWRSPGLRIPEFALVIRLGLGTKSFLGRGTQLTVGEGGTPALLTVLCPLPNTCEHVVGTHRCLEQMNLELLEAGFPKGLVRRGHFSRPVQNYAETYL